MLEKPTVSKRLYCRCLLFNILKHNLLSILFLSFTNDFCGKLLGEQSGKFFNGYIHLYDSGTSRRLIFSRKHQKS